MADLETVTLPVLPLTNDVVLPGMVVTLALETDEARSAADAAATAGDTLLLVPRHPDGRYAAVGTIARIENRGNLPGGMNALVIRATSRAEVGLGVIGQTSGLWVHASPVDDGEVTDEVATLATELRAALRALFEALGGRRLTEVLRGVDDPAALADLVGWWPDLSVERKVELLETLDLPERLRRVLGWVKDGLAEHQLSEKIRNDVTEGLEDRQREFLLRQQMDAIRKELGEDDDDSAQSYRERLTALVGAKAVPAATEKAIAREIDRFERTPEQNVEHGWIRNWLDTVFEIPWGERSVDDYDIDRARAVLDADHTGLDEVKERIVEMLAVRKLLAERAAEEAAASDGPPRADSDGDGAGTAHAGEPEVADDAGTTDIGYDGPPRTTGAPRGADDGDRGKAHVPDQGSAPEPGPAPGSNAWASDGFLAGDPRRRHRPGACHRQKNHGGAWRRSESAQPSGRRGLRRARVPGDASGPWRGGRMIRAGTARPRGTAKRAS